MSLGQRLLELRKKKNLSQEEVAEKLDVSRQTISKWETDQSTPDFDKIIPLCELYAISSEELLKGKKDNIKEETEISVNNSDFKKKKALGIGGGILIYFLAIAWIMVTIPVLKMNPIISSAIFLIICGLATFVIVYTSYIYKNSTFKINNPVSKLERQIKLVLASFFTVIYLVISFTTFAWHITWILWVVYGLVAEIVKLIFMLKEDK